MKKEEIYVKLTKNNIDKVISILKEAGCEYDFSRSRKKLNNDIFKELYLSYRQFPFWYKWTISLFPPNKTRIKPKQLKELLENEPAYSSKYWDNPLWQMAKGGIGDKGLEYKPKTLEVGKWYKYPNLLDGKLMFLFMGEFGGGTAIGFDARGEYRDAIGVHEHKIPEYSEAKPEEVIEAFIYHMKTFANKRKNIKTAELRDILNQFHREEISFSKVVELINKGGK